MKQKIILASTSPRRKGLLQQIGIEFKIVPSNYEEDMTLNIPPNKLAMTLARGKAIDVANKLKEGIVIGADTFVCTGKTLLGKPKNKEDAKQMLRKCSGKTLKVYSGVAVIDAHTKKEIVDYEITKIELREITEKEIISYVNSREPLDKAGAMCMQGLGAIFVKKVDGCYHNSLGLPLHKISQILQKFKVDIFEYEKWKNYIE